jgi:hypothetical protein
LKRRSATSSRPPEPVFFADENLGRIKFPQRLRDAAVRLEVHLDYFRQGAPDDEWLPEIGKRGWVLLTLDSRLRYNRLEQRAIMENRVAAFVLVGGDTHDEKAVVFLRAQRRIRSFLAGHKRPFIAKVYDDGRVKMWLNEAAWRKGRRRW